MPGGRDYTVDPQPVKPVSPTVSKPVVKPTTPTTTKPTTPPVKPVPAVKPEITYRGNRAYTKGPDGLWVRAAGYDKAAGQPTNVTPTKAVPGTGDINVADYGGQMVTDPQLPANLGSKVPTLDPNTPGTNIAKSPYQNSDMTAKLTTAQTATATTTQPKKAADYQAQLTAAEIAKNGQMKAAQGQLSAGSKITAPQLDMQGAATGFNADGSVNYTGQALQQYARQDITNIIDTSTPAGKALAQKLGDGNYTDSKATLQGQLQMLQSQFVGPSGEPKIPAWAAGTARNVSKIAAFKGMSGTAATAAMAQALMEASIPVAQQDAAFFQTVTLQNLNNKQASTINRANVLAKFDLANLDNRMAAAVENSKAFLQMDLANLDNRQQAEIINTQTRVQSILEDAKAVNAQRLFHADSQNDMDKFYDNLNSQIKMFNATQQNGMNQFNASEANNMSKYNTDLENNRDQFYKNMQYNIDVANAKWRQTVTLTTNSQKFEAAATDVKNMVSISSEQLSRLWDRSDALLDYLWKSTESEADRKSALAITKLQAKLKSESDDKAGLGSIFGTLAGKVADSFLSGFQW